MTKNLKPYQNNNYRRLISHVSDYSKETCFINFNYDLILENSLFSKDISNINSYIAGTTKFKIIKIHGSCNWMYKLELPPNTNIKNDSGLEEIISLILSNPDYINYSKEHNETPYTICQNEWYKDGCLYHPAIAIPLFGKSNFICPQFHIEQLKKFLKQTDRILIIGWAANDYYFIKTLEENLNKNPLTEIPITIISQTKSGAENVKGKLQHIKKLKFGLNFESFSQFVTRDQCEKFFKD